MDEDLSDPIHEPKRANAVEPTRNLRLVSLITSVIGAIVSIVLFLFASPQAPAIIIVLFVGWLFAPFGAFLMGIYLSNQWPVLVRRGLYLVIILLTTASVSIYAYQFVFPRQTTPAFWWVAVPPVSVIITVVTVVVTAIVSRSRKTRPQTFM